MSVFTPTYFPNSLGMFAMKIYRHLVMTKSCSIIISENLDFSIFYWPKIQIKFLYQFYPHKYKDNRQNTDRAFKRLTRMMERRAGPHRSVFAEKFTRTELDNSLKKCKLKKAPGPDEVTNEVININVNNSTTNTFNRINFSHS